MASHPYEYRILVEYINPEQRGKTVHFAREEDQEAFTGMLEEVFTHLPESIPAGWTVNSHNISVARDTFVVTVLLQRPVK